MYLYGFDSIDQGRPGSSVLNKFFTIGVAIAAFSAGNAAAEVRDVTMVFPDMAPYLVSDPVTGAVDGPVAHRVEQVARLAGVHVHWRGPVPRARILSDLARLPDVCTPNVFATPEREALFKFSAPLSGGIDWVVVTRPDADWMSAHPSFASLLGDGRRSFGNLLGASRGERVDEIVERHAANTRMFRGTPGDMLKLLLAGRVDYILMNAADTAYAARSLNLPADSILEHRFPDLNTDDAGRIMCSKGVDDAVIAKLNDAIARAPQVR